MITKLKYKPTGKIVTVFVLESGGVFQQGIFRLKKYEKIK